MKKALMVGAVAALGLFGFGCQDNRTPANDNAGTGGSGYTTGTQQQDTTQTPRLGDGKIGNNNGVIDDGEGPLEGNSGKADDKIGDQPGVWNDGEGPIESTPLNRPSDSGKSFNNNAGQNDNAPDSNNTMQQNQ